MERAIVDNILELAKSISSPALERLSSSLEVIEHDKWQLLPKNLPIVNQIYQEVLMKSKPDLTEEYVVIAIYGGPKSGEHAISKIDGAPGYLHIHAIKTSEFEKLPIILTAETMLDEKEQKIYQWGMSADKDLGTRAPIVSIGDILQYCNLGIGSAAIGGHEEKSSFVGGGEVFIVPEDSGVKAFRVTKGQGVFPMFEDEKCWTFEGVKDTKSLIVPVEESKRNVASRSELLNLLQSLHDKGDVPFVARFKGTVANLTF